MKILQIHNFYRTPGGECSVVKAENRLLKQYGHTIQQFSVDSGGIVAQSLGRKALGFLQIPYNIEAARQLTKLLHDFQPDIAHVHNVFPLLSPSMYVVLKRKCTNVIQTIHNYRFLCPNGLFFTGGRICQQCMHDGFMAAVRNKCVRNSYPISAMYAAAIGLAWQSGSLPTNIDRYIALNQFGADMLASGGVPRERIRICGNFIEHTSVSPKAKHFYILYLGRLSPEKGLWTLLKAMRGVPAGITLKIGGTGPMEVALKDYVAAYSLPVEFLGFVAGDEKERLIAGAICTIVPSEWFENFPMSVLESLALGTPVIASRIGGLPEMIEHEVSGLLFEPGDIEGLLRAIRRVSENTEEAMSMAAAALAAARSRFGPEAHIRGLQDIYAEVVDHA